MNDLDRDLLSRSRPRRANREIDIGHAAGAEALMISQRPIIRAGTEVAGWIETPAVSSGAGCAGRDGSSRPLNGSAEMRAADESWGSVGLCLLAPVTSPRRERSARARRRTAPADDRVCHAPGDGGTAITS